MECFLEEPTRHVQAGAKLHFARQQEAALRGGKVTDEHSVAGGLITTAGAHHDAVACGLPAFCATTLQRVVAEWSTAEHTTNTTGTASSGRFARHDRQALSAQFARGRRDSTVSLCPRA